MHIEPENRELWQQFQACEKNEMIITKNGRCLFPLLKFHVVEDDEMGGDASTGSHSLYSYAVSIERMDGLKWKFRHGHWHSMPVVGSHHNIDCAHFYEPDTSPATWTRLQRDGMNFCKVKLTNRKEPSSSTSIVSLQSDQNGTGSLLMHMAPVSISPADPAASSHFSLSSFAQYVPVVYIVNWNRMLAMHPGLLGPVGVGRLLSQLSWRDLIREGSLQRIVAQECAFVAVTHYQNELITHLKKRNNPHAKGFILSDSSMGRAAETPHRGRPGRKKRSQPAEDGALSTDTRHFLAEGGVPSTDTRHFLAEGGVPSTDTRHFLSEDVLMASLALEKMANSQHSIPRYRDDEHDDTETARETSSLTMTEKQRRLLKYP